MSTTTPCRFRNITPSDTVAVNCTLGIFVGGAGIIKATGVDGVVATFTVSAGQYLIGQFHRVLATGTTATALVSLSSV